MFNFTYYTPTQVVFGRDAEAHTGALVKSQGCKKVLIHYGGGSVVRSGLLDRVKASLEREGIAYAELGGVVPNPRLSLVRQGIELRRREGVSSLEELRQKEASPKVAQAIAAQLGLSMEQARRLHLDMLIYTVGLGTIFSVTMPGIPAQEVFARQERAYQAFLKQAKEEPGHEE